MKSGASLVSLLALLTLACTDKDAPNDEMATGDTGTGDTEDSAGLTGEDELGTEDDAGTADDTVGDTGGDGDCALGEYIPTPFIDIPDWSSSSGNVSHTVSHSWLEAPSHRVRAVFYTSDAVDDSTLCVEPLVEPTGIDSCRVWYTQGEGLGGDGGLPEPNYVDLAVTTATFDVGDGPLALEVGAATEFTPSSYGLSLPAPPDGVPYGGVATLAATFADLPALELGLDVPTDIMPLGHAIDTTTLSSEQLASWTWTTPGGAAPIELKIELGATPVGSGWNSWVQIECEATDDGEFAFPVEYLDLARERLGPQIYASARITREIAGTEVLADKDLHWSSSVGAWLAIEVVD